MAEVASDDHVSSTGNAVEYGMTIPAEEVAPILARLRKAEADNANLTKLLQGYHQICSEAGIAPATSEIYAAAERATQGGENG